MDVTNGDFNGVVMFTFSMRVLLTSSQSLLLLLLRSALDDGVITTGSEYISLHEEEGDDDVDG